MAYEKQYSGKYSPASMRRPPGQPTAQVVSENVMNRPYPPMAEQSAGYQFAGPGMPYPSQVPPGGRPPIGGISRAPMQPPSSIVAGGAPGFDEITGMPVGQGGSPVGMQITGSGRMSSPQRGPGYAPAMRGDAAPPPPAMPGYGGPPRGGRPVQPRRQRGVIQGIMSIPPQARG